MNNLGALKQAMRKHGVTRLYAKQLAPNDNSKNQVYFGPNFEAANIFPFRSPEPDVAGERHTPTFKAQVDFSWLLVGDQATPAPEAKLILYPEYPEIRFSGFLRGCDSAPTELMGGTRAAGRILFLGVTDDRRVIGYVSAEDSPLSNEFRALQGLEAVGVFFKVPLHADAGTFDSLAREICRISELGWIDAKRLDSSSAVNPCSSANCGGYTLEAELGILPNSRSTPDYHGWEIKQIGNTGRSSDSLPSKRVTLMTPEPTGGAYRELALADFVDRFGYADRQGRADRRNFGGIHRFGVQCSSTLLTLRLVGFDSASAMIADAEGGIALTAADGTIAASWTFSSLLSLWNRKHAQAAYILSEKRAGPPQQYRYWSRMWIGQGTDFMLFLKAVADGSVCYDPGIKVVQREGRAHVKKRSQFRVSARRLSLLYRDFRMEDACHT